MAGKVRLQITAGPMQGRSFTFEDHDTFIFGRDPECHARLDEKDASASRHHFMLEVNPPDARVRDLGSLNGTHVNGTKIGGREAHETVEQGRARRFAEFDLKRGDRLNVGASVFVVDVEAPALCNVCSATISESDRSACATPSGGFVCRSCRVQLASQQTVLPVGPAAVLCKNCGKDVSSEVGQGDAAVTTSADRARCRSPKIRSRCSFAR